MQLGLDAAEKCCRKRNEKTDAIVRNRRMEQKNGAEGILTADHTESSLDLTEETTLSDTDDLGSDRKIVWKRVLENKRICL